MSITFQRKEGNEKRTAGGPGADFDRELARRIMEGDRNALARLLDRHLGGVYGYVRRRLGPGNEELASEVTAATFERAFRSIKPYARGAASTPMRWWLIRLASEELARRNKQVTRVSSPPLTGESHELISLRKALDSLPRRRQMALSLALFEGLTADELAAALGASLPRAMRLLRSALKQAGKVVDAEELEQL